MAEFEWDETKNRSNIAKHKIDFADAVRIFERPTLDYENGRHDYGERRIVSIGLLDEAAIVVVVHTDRRGVVRIISARQANRMERVRYEQSF